MNLALLHITSTDDILDALENKFASIVTSRVAKGQKYTVGEKVHEESSISLEIADCDTPKQLCDALSNFFGELGNDSETLLKRAFESELSIGVTVGDSVQYVAYVSFSPALMGILERCGVELSVTAYPTSDEANED